MQQTIESSSAKTVSYLALRRAIGVLGVMLPVILAAGYVLTGGEGIRPSISDYYHTEMRDLFVGILCAIGVFLWSYRGYEGEADNLAGNIAGLGAVGTALIPNGTEPSFIADTISGLIGFNPHSLFAGIFMLAMAFFCLYLFTRSGTTTPGAKKLVRNRIYRFCGRLIVLFVVLIGVYIAIEKYTSIDLSRIEDVVFWLESAAIWAFGVAWFIKGDTLFKDA